MGGFRSNFMRLLRGGEFSGARPRVRMDVLSLAAGTSWVEKNARFVWSTRGGAVAVHVT